MPVLTLLREPARPAAVREHRHAPWFAVGTVCFGAFMGQLDASIVTLAFPALQRQFGTSLAAVQWVSLAYLLVLIALLVPAGRLSDRVGRKLSYLLGFAVFAVASAACGLAGSLPVLISMRIVQAAGAALLQANSVALVSASVPARQRRAALGIQAAAQAVGLAAGPIAGGLIVGYAGWRWIFCLNVPVAVVALAAGWLLLPRTRTHSRAAARDSAGLVLLATAATGVLVGLSLLSGGSAPGWAVPGCAAVALLAAAGLVRSERRAAAPLLGGAALGARLRPALAGAMCAYLVLFGPLVLIPQVLAQPGDSAVRAGLVLASLPAGFGLTAMAGERLLPRRWSNAGRCVRGAVLAAACLAALAVPAPHLVTAVLLGLAGAGLGCYIPANNADVMAVTPAAEAATAGGMVNMTRGIGTALGVAIVTLALHAGAPSVRAGQALAAAALATAAAAAAWAGHRSGVRDGVGPAGGARQTTDGTIGS
jgi:MFS family permease